MANQAATAIENAQSYEALEALNRDLERKVENGPRPCGRR